MVSLLQLTLNPVPQLLMQRQPRMVQQQQHRHNQAVLKLVVYVHQMAP
jgi:hypothetical protein